jgi:hypothetical protein
LPPESPIDVQLPVSLVVACPEVLAVPVIVPPLIVVAPASGVRKLIRLVSPA